VPEQGVNVQQLSDNPLLITRMREVFARHGCAVPTARAGERAGEAYLNTGITTQLWLTTSVPRSAST
jgi:hypothetical protein